MIKLIASDLDGTLLTADHRLPDETFALIDRLYEKGILFCPASGRQYANLRLLFTPVADKIVFLCENGGLIVHREKVLFTCPTPPELVRFALEKIRAIDGLHPMLCCEEYAYIDSENKAFQACSFAAYTNCKKVKNLDEIVGKKDVLKIAVYDEKRSAEHCIRLLPERLPMLHTTLSGAHWSDVSVPDAHKGTGIRFIQRHFGFTADECVAFGDQMNDYEMLLACGHPFVTENAHPPLKEEIGNVVPSCEDGGVIQKIKAILEEN